MPHIDFSFNGSVIWFLLMALVLFIGAVVLIRQESRAISKS